MMRLKVGAVGALPPGSVTEVEGPDARYAVCNLDGKLFCLDGTCPHAGGPLGQGALNGSMLVCPWHGWEFDCRTGVNDFDEDVQQTMFPVIVEGGDIFIEVP
jgi:nitrite reductase/ring-hydroxylating ferredoxin subunit